ncbi:unnamed protein product [Sphagnum jensenii]|uniref:Uncharacterized protein n=1 Tax=Sphagnum jensenii TaxID=128206 RepID=A0ABP0VJE4_9BRYO
MQRTVPFRMLAAKYGADITCGAEIVDHRRLRCTPKINKMLGTVDLVEKDTDTVVFWTWDKEKSPAVFKIGTSDAVQAVQAANLVKVAYRPRGRTQWDGVAEVVVPLLISEDEKALVTCISCLTKLVGRLRSEELMAKLPSFLLVLFDAFDNRIAEVRKVHI